MLGLRPCTLRRRHVAMRDVKSHVHHNVFITSVRAKFPIVRHFAVCSRHTQFHSFLVRKWCSFRAFSCSTQRGLSTKMPVGRPMIKFRKITENASPPTRATKYSAGYDLRSAYDYTVPPKSKLLLATDLEIALPDGFYGRIAPRSGLALKNFIDVGGGVIDQDYRGPLGVILFNFGNEEFRVTKGDRIAQLICEKICYPDLEEVPVLDDTTRGSGGFGSSGMQ